MHPFIQDLGFEEVAVFATRICNKDIGAQLQALD